MDIVGFGRWVRHILVGGSDQDRLELRVAETERELREMDLRMIRAQEELLERGVATGQAVPRDASMLE